MFYTLLKFLGWGLLLAFIGGCIGWALRALKARSELARVRSSMVDADEGDNLRHLVADLEQAVAERDRLRIQLADVRHVDSPGIVGADVPPPDVLDPDAHETTGPDEDPSRPDDGAETSEDPIAAEPEAAPQDDREELPGTPIVTDSDLDGDPVPEPEPDPGVVPDRDPDLDLKAARAVLGKTVTLDDLTVVEGIGPKISELCSGVGVTTWRQLADTDVAELQSILDAAGSRYSVHKPATWPHQAELLATGQWSEFRAFTEGLKRGT